MILMLSFPIPDLSENSELLLICVYISINNLDQVPFSGLRGGVQYDEVADGGDVIGKAAGFSSAMAVKCAIRVEMVSCIWGSMLVFLWIHLISTERAMLSAPPRYFSPKNFAASTAHNHCPHTTLLPSPFPPTKFFAASTVHNHFPRTMLLLSPSFLF